MTNRCIVLLGIGHTHAEIIRRWAKSPPTDCRLVCISKFPFATYSGMLPGTLANQFEPQQMQIDLASLVQRSGGELVLGDVIGLDLATRTLMFEDAAPLNFDVLSIGVGSMPAGWQDFTAASLVPIKPMQTFLERVDQRLASVLEATNRPPKVAIVGAGVAGIEIALCLHTRLRQQLGNDCASIELFTSDQDIGGDLNQRSVRKLRQFLHRRGINTVCGSRVTQVTNDAIVTDEVQPHAADCVIWCTGAAAPPVLAKLGLATDDNGFIATQRTLQVTSGLPIFAVGDSGTIIEDPAPKAGVYAVREAPILWHNLHALLGGTSMKGYDPQSDYLKLLNTGDGKALLQYKGFAVHASWCWWLKTHIDKRFVTQYQG